MRSALATAAPDESVIAPPLAIENTKPNTPWPLLAKDKYTVVRITDFALLDTVTEKWTDLAANALEPNPFYAPPVLRPALASLGAGHDLRVVLIFAPNRARPTEPLLCGIFPLERRRRYRGTPCRTLSLWQHQFDQPATPLIRASHAGQTLEAFFAWLAGGDHGCSLMAFNRISGEGPFHHRFVDYLDHNAVLHHVEGCFARDLPRPLSDAETNLRTPQSSEHRPDQGLRDCRLLRDVVVGTGSRRADLLVSLLPLCGWLKALTKPRAQSPREQ